MTEFNLSKKVYNKNQGIGDPGYNFVHERDIKEFIRLLKLDLCQRSKEVTGCGICTNCKIIEELAGENF